MIAWPEANAFVLQRQPYRESSWLVRLLTASRGQITALWRDRTAIYLFQPYACHLSNGHSLVLLRDAQFAGSVLRLSGRASFLGLYLNELCGHLAPRDVSEPALFGSYYAALRALQHSDDPEPYLRYFELSLLQSLGQAPDFERDANGSPIQSNQGYRFDGVNQFILSGTPGSSNVVTGQEIQAMAQRQFTEERLRLLIRKILRQALAHQLGGRPLRARELLRPTGPEVPQ